MGTRHTDGEGITTFKPATLSAETRQAIADQLTRIKVIPQDQCERFYERLEHAVGCYHAQVEIGAQNRPAAVRQALCELESSLRAFCEKWDGMPGTARRLIRECGASTREVSRLLADLEAAVPAAQHNAETIPRRDPARQALANDVARALLEELEIRPTTTGAGLFEAVLYSVLFEATGTEPNETRSLRDKAVQNLKQTVSDKG